MAVAVFHEELGYLVKSAMTLHQLENVLQPYAWGSRDALTELLGVPNPTEEPQAELWMGAHPKGPSRFVGQDVSLLERIEAEPERYLGAGVAARFGGRLPYLFKVLAAERPLSLQAHPSREQARAGYAREREAGLAADDPRRNYHDDNHKPELLCALTRFWALCGFREPAETLRLVRAFGLDEAAGPLVALRDGDGAGCLARTFRALFEIPVEERRSTIFELVRGAQGVLQRTPREIASPDDSQVYWAARWTLRLADLYPEDPGVIAALLLNIVELSPGESIYLPARELHSYLGGVGLEIMASSDNVLRGGLTPKRVDLAELMRVLTFEPCVPRISSGEETEWGGGREITYPTPASEFCLSRIELEGEGRSTGGCGPEILLCLEGRPQVRRNGERLTLEQGGSAFCEASDVPFEILGPGSLARARVG